METPLEIADGDHFPAIVQNQSQVLSANSLIETMGLAKKDEKSLTHLINDMHSDVMKALNEVTAITTHDTNLEKQYNEVVAENMKLNQALYRARRQVTSLKGKLTVLEMMPSEIREENKRKNFEIQSTIKQESRLQAQRMKNINMLSYIEVPSFQERSQTVNHFGEYIDYSSARKSQKTGKRRRRVTYPMRCAPATSIKTVPLPPSMIGCSCSICNTQQSLGTFTFGKKHKTFTKSQQQILLGDRVIVGDQNLGTVKYIGKLEFDRLDRLFIGVHLDAPIGISDGEVKGKRYFNCPPGHGVFVLPHNILSVIGRKAQSTGTSIPRIREGPLITLNLLPSTCPQISESVSKTPPITETTPTSIEQANEILEREMKQLFLEQKSPSELVNPSVAEMSKRIIQLQKQPRPRHSEQETTDHHPAEIQRPLSTDIQQPLSTDNNNNNNNNIDIAIIYDNILAELQAKDLGNTGYVTIIELSTALEKTILLSKQQVNSIVVEMGLDRSEGHGIEYGSIIQRLAETVANIKQ